MRVFKNNETSIDYNNTSEGYISVAYTGDADKKCKLQIRKDGQMQNFTVQRDAKAFPLCFWDGRYTAMIAQQIEGTRYKSLVTLPFDVNLRTPFVPWLNQNTYCDYGPDSTCVRVAAGISRAFSGDVRRITGIYQWIIGNIEYDYALAKKIREKNMTWWLPEPDGVIEAGKSICWGYSSLFAAMCRSQGIPCKIVVGPVKGTGNHAWNEVYSRKPGIVNGLAIQANAWSRLDLTFMDTSRGGAAAFVREDTNYTAEYYG